jgi:plastocyanin
VARSRSRLAAALAALALAAGSGCAALPWRSPGRVVLRGAEPGPAAVLYLEPAGGGAEPARGAVVDIRSRGSSFRAPLTVVQVGDRVRFVNEGEVAHRLFTTGDAGRRERLVAAGGRAEPLVVSQAGENRFYCSLHPDESFVVFASPSPWFAVVTSAGERQIDGVPGGRYRLTLWSEAGTRPLGSLQVRPGAVTALALDGESRAGD